MNVFLSVVALLAGFLRTGPANGQGSAVVMPLSKAVTDPSESVVFYIHNQIEETLSLSYDLKCDIDGKDEQGEVCAAAFDAQFDIAPKDGKIVIPKHGKVTGNVRLKNKGVRFALYKPIFTPLLPADQKENLVTFQMKYQPGYLFLVRPGDEKISQGDFRTVDTETARRFKFQLDISNLTVPQVIGVTVKVLKKADKKLVRLVRVASDKIADPKRKTLDLEGDFAEKGDKTEVCYEMYITNLGSKAIDKRTNCL